jgi:hypothetical protein
MRATTGATMMDTRTFLARHLATIAAAAAEGAAYGSWSDEFARKEVREVWRNQPTGFRKWLGKTVTIAALKEVPFEELSLLGFARWDDNLVVLPLWAFHLIADGERLVCIDGSTAVKGTDETDLDTRGGCVAWGFRPAA